MRSENSNTAEDVSEPPIAWMNGQFLPDREVRLPLSDLGLHGVAVSEMLRTYGRELFQLEAHLARLTRSAELIGITADPEALRGVAIDLVRRNALPLAAGQELGLVILLTAGANPLLTGAGGAAATQCIHTFELPLHRWADAVRSGLRLRTSTVPALPAECVPSAAKTRNRLHWHLAAREVASRDPGAVALLLSGQGLVTETPSANILAFLDDTLVTPRTNVLPGISAKVVQELSGQLGLEFIERDLRPDELLRAEEVILSSTPFGLLAVAEIDGVSISDGRPGPIFFELCGAWSERVGIDIIEQLASARREQTD